MTAERTERVLFRERIYPALSTFVIGFLFILMVAIAYGAAINLVVGLVLWLCGTAIFLAITQLASPVIEISSGSDGPLISAERATSPISVFSNPVVMSGPDRLAVRQGVRFKTAFGGLRGKMPAILLTVNDENDPHEAWILSTRQPDKLLLVLAGLDIR